MKNYKIKDLVNDQALFEDFLDEARLQPVRNEEGFLTDEVEKTPVMGANHNVGLHIKNGFSEEILEELNNNEDIPVDLMNEGQKHCIGDFKQPIKSMEVIAELNNYLYNQGIYNDYEMAHAKGRNTLLKKGKEYLKQGKTEEELEQYNKNYYKKLWDVLHKEPSEIKEEAHMRDYSSKQALNEWKGAMGEYNSKGYKVRAWDGFSKNNPKVKSKKFYTPVANTEKHQEEMIKKFPDGKETLDNLGYKAKLQGFNNLAKGLYGSAGHYFRDEYQTCSDSLKGQLNELTIAGMLTDKGVNMKDLQVEETKVDNYDNGVDLVDEEGINHQVKSSKFFYSENYADLKPTEMGNLQRRHPESLVHFVGINGKDKGSRKELEINTTKVKDMDIPRNLRSYKVAMRDLKGETLNDKEISERMEKNAELAHKNKNRMSKVKDLLKDKIKEKKLQEKVEEETIVF